MVPEINYIAVVLATLSSMLVGTVWYSPRVFGNYWMKAAGVTPSDKASDAVRPIIVTVIVSFITAWVLAGAAFIALTVSPRFNALCETYRRLDWQRETVVTAAGKD